AHYKDEATLWHSWEKYFHLIHYRVLTMSLSELADIQGEDEGLEHRLKKTAHKSTSFSNWMEAIKTKRYTLTRLQPMFIHLLTNTKKTDITASLNNNYVPYVQLLVFKKKVQAY